MEDSRRNAHQRRSKEYTTMTKRWNSNNSNSKKKKKRQLVKVVYISNPMHFKASAAEFKGLVQHFTGQDSDVDADLFKFAGADHYSPVDAVDADGASSFSTDDDSAAALSRPAAGAAAVEQYQQQEEEEEPYRWAEVLMPPFDAFDDEVFSPQALENLAAFMPPTAASLCYEHPR